MMRTIRSGDALQFSAIVEADLPAELNDKSSNKAAVQRRSKLDLSTSLASMDGKFSTNRSDKRSSSQMRQVKAKKVRDRDVEKRRRSQNEVSAVCFPIDACLLDKQDDCIKKQFHNFFVSHLQLLCDNMCLR
jgi:hypothetical protein